VIVYVTFSSGKKEIPASTPPPKAKRNEHPQLREELGN
jgi:hypothetical protein